MASVNRRASGSWRARYRDAAGKEHARHFDRKADAERWLDAQCGTLVQGTWVDPQLGRTTVRQYAEQWHPVQMVRPTTLAMRERTLRLHVYPGMGERRLASLRRLDLQSWVAELSCSRGPAVVHQAYSLLRTMLAQRGR